MKRILVLLAVILMIVSLCGCISEKEDLEPVPDNVDTTLILASELQAALEGYQVKYPAEGEQLQAMFDSLKSMAEAQTPDYSAISISFL